MGIIRIEEKCNLCMLCVKDCVSGVWRDVDGVPTVAAPEDCNRCSHCVSICPKNAIRHDSLDEKQIRDIEKSLINPEAYYEITATRRSVRHYKDDPVPGEIVNKILNLANYSPTASNSQNVKYIVIQDKKQLKHISKLIFDFSKRILNWTRSIPGKIILTLFKNTAAVGVLNRYIGTMDYYIKETDTGRDFILHHAPTLILIHAPKGANFSCDNCNISATNIINYAHALGLGTCFIGFLTLALKYSKSLRRRLSIPKDSQVYASLILGYPKYRHLHTASRKPPEIDIIW